MSAVATVYTDPPRVQYLFLIFVVNVEFFASHFPVTTLGLYMFSGTYLNKLLFLWCPVIENSSV